MLPELDTCYWESVFAYAGEGLPADGDGPQAPTAVLSDPNVGVEPFTREDVARIVAMEEGENDGPAWIGVFGLRDGRFAYVEAGCDYTGFDCAADGFSHVANDLDVLVRFGVGQEARRRLGMALPEDNAA